MWYGDGNRCAFHARLTDILQTDFRFILHSSVHCVPLRFINFRIKNHNYMQATTTSFGIEEALEQLGIKAINKGTSTGSNWFSDSGEFSSSSPVDGKVIAKVTTTSKADYEKVMKSATSAFKTWRLKPAPQRGEIVRQFGDELRRLKEPLGKLVSYEMGKSYQEGLGEVQEMIDICDFAVGLSRQLHGFTMHSERPGHR